jgi:hypothetical protein
MIDKGIVSSIESSGARVILPNKENTVSAPLPSASGVGLLNIGDNVVVAFFSDNLQDGIILAKF